MVARAAFEHLLTVGSADGHRVIDDTDHALLLALVDDPRATYTELGERVGLTRSPARQRMTRLLESGIVGVTAVIDPHRLDLGIDTVHIVALAPGTTLHGLPSVPTVEVVFESEVQGGSGAILVVRTPDLERCRLFLRRLHAHGGVDGIETMTVLRYLKSDWDEAHPKSTPAPDVSARLDEIDFRVVAELVRDGRRSFTDLSATIGLSESATRSRVGRLVEKGIIRFQAIPGYDTMRAAQFLNVFAQVRGDFDAAARDLVALPSVSFAAEVAGRYHLAFEMFAPEPDRAAAIARVEALPGVHGVRSFVITRLLRDFGVDRRE